MTTPWMIAMLALWGVEVVTAVLVVGLIRRVGGVLERAEGMMAGDLDALAGGAEPGTRVAPFRAIDEGGNVKDSSDILGVPTMLLFMDWDCAPCHALAQVLTDEAVDRVGLPIVAVLHESQTPRPRLPLPPTVSVVYQRNSEVSHALSTSTTPHAFIIDPDRVVRARRVPGSPLDLEALAHRTREEVISR